MECCADIQRSRDAFTAGLFWYAIATSWSIVNTASAACAGVAATVTANAVTSLAIPHNTRIDLVHRRTGTICPIECQRASPPPNFVRTLDEPPGQNHQSNIKSDSVDCRKAGASVPFPAAARRIRGWPEPRTMLESADGRYFRAV